jgi:hypothetical protein
MIWVQRWVPVPAGRNHTGNPAFLEALGDHPAALVDHPGDPLVPVVYLPALRLQSGIQIQVRREGWPGAGAHVDGQGAQPSAFDRLAHEKVLGAF